MVSGAGAAGATAASTCEEAVGGAEEEVASAKEGGGTGWNWALQGGALVTLSATFIWVILCFMDVSLLCSKICD